MSKETEITLSVTVKDGPKTQPQKTTLPKKYCPADVYKAANEEVEIDKKKPKKCVELPELDEDKHVLSFVTIHADRYLYKDHCGAELPGIWYYQEGCDTVGEYLDGPHVYIHRPLQKLAFTKLHFVICKDMLDCIKDDKVVINVTYGVGHKKDCKHEAGCPPCDMGSLNALPAAVSTV